MITLAEREGLEGMRPGQKTQESGEIVQCNIQAVRQLQGAGLGELEQWEGPGSQGHQRGLVPGAA